MELSVAKKSLTKIASALGFFQGFIWTILAFIVIGLHYANVDFTLEPDDGFNRQLQLAIYETFVHKNATARDSFIIRPDEFVIFTWIYLFLCITWTILSGFQYFIFRFNKEKADNIMLVWGTLTLAICLIDFIFVCLMGRDYDECSELDIKSPTGVVAVNVYCYLTYGVVMTIIARGYVLWIINLMFALMLRHFSSKIKLIKKSGGGLRPSSSAYGNATIPRIPQADYGTSFNSRRATNQTPPISRSMDNISGYNNNGFQEYSRPPPPPAQQQMQPYRGQNYY